MKSGVAARGAAVKETMKVRSLDVGAGAQAGGSLMRIWLVSGLLAVPAAWVGARLAVHGSGRLAALGWLLAALNGSVALWMQSRAVGRDLSGFMRLGVLWNSVRFAAFVVGLVLLRVFFAAVFEPLALAAVAAALVFMGGEVYAMARRS
jgi:hypothetical protein